MIVKERKAERAKAHRAKARTSRAPFDPQGRAVEGEGERKEGRRTRTRRFERRKTYETKLAYERWEAGQVWKAGLEAPEAPRRKANQGGRTRWIREKLEAEARGLRYYETQPRDYRTRFDPARGEGSEADPRKDEDPSRTPGPVGTPVASPEARGGWGFWKAYEREEAVRVGRWKKAIVQKKALAGARHPRLPWDRGGRRGETQASRETRVTRTQARRRVRDGGKGGTPVERTLDPGAPVEGSQGEEGRKPRRTLGGESLEAPEPFGPGRGRGRTQAASGRVGRASRRRRRDEAFWTQVGKTQDGTYTSRRAQAGVPSLGPFHPEEEAERRERLEAEVVPRLTRKAREETGERDPGQARVLAGERARKRREVDEVFEDRTRKAQGEARWNPYRKRARRRGRRRELGEGGRKEGSRGRCRSG